MRKGSRDLVSLDLRFWKGMVGKTRECDVACNIFRGAFVLDRGSHCYYQ